MAIAQLMVHLCVSRARLSILVGRSAYAIVICFVRAAGAGYLTLGI